VLVVVVVAAMAYLAWTGMRIGVSDRLRHRVDLELVSALQREMVAQDQWRRWVSDSADATSWWSFNAEAHELRSRVAAFGVARFASSERERVEGLEASLDSMRSALALRPGWPYAHAQLATLKAQAGRYDDEFRHAVRVAIRLGANEVGVRRQLAELWLLGSDRAVPELAEVFASSMRVVLAQSYPERIVERADRVGRGGDLCGWDALPEMARSRCTWLGYSDPPSQ